MLFAIEPHVKATITFLRLLRVKVNASTVNETLQNHPDSSSLLSISDALTAWKVPNGAGRIDPAHFDELPVPFIAVTKSDEAPLAIVTEVKDSYVRLLANRYKKEVTQSRSDFVNNWFGVYLIAEPNAHSGEHDYKMAKRKEIIASLIPVAAAVVLVFLATFVFWRNIKNDVAENTFPATGIFLQYVITLAGLFVSSMLLWYETDSNNPLLHRVCTGISKGDCTAILTGKAAKVFSWLSWSEVGFFYYAGALLCMLFAGSDMLPYISIIALFNLLAMPYPVFSVYYQWRVAKQWCVLCLAVQTLLVAGVINVLANHLYDSMDKITFPILVQGFLLYAAPLLVWFTIQPLILKLQQAKSDKRDYFRIKFNAEIFETLLSKQKQVNIPADNLGIDLGNPTAKNTLIKVCNPYCGPCGKVHPDIEKLLEEIPDVKVKIIFTTMNSDDDRMSKPARHLMAIAEMSDENTLKRALDDWYLADEKDYEVFAGKYPVNGLLQQQDKKIEAMHWWCNEIKIQSTPTFFINGYQLPRTYSIADLKYFLLE
jgi:thiol-disulfide isomerase/thioredoxin